MAQYAVGRKFIGTNDRVMGFSPIDPGIEEFVRLTAMSTPPVYEVNSPWEDRWAKPELEQLLAPLDEQRRKVVDILIDQIKSFDGVELSVIWHGTAWKWTLQFSLYGPDGNLIDTLAYLVPKPEVPVLCVPLRAKTVEKLPLRRLNRYVRDSIRVAKRAVDIYWAVWTPSAVTETEHLRDLFKRIHKIMMAQNAG
jgi:hypothetical protein